MHRASTCTCLTCLRNRVVRGRKLNESDCPSVCEPAYQFDWAAYDRTIRTLGLNKRFRGSEGAWSNVCRTYAANVVPCTLWIACLNLRLMYVFSYHTQPSRIGMLVRIPVDNLIHITCGLEPFGSEDKFDMYRYSLCSWLIIRWLQ